MSIKITRSVLWLAISILGTSTLVHAATSTGISVRSLRTTGSVGGQAGSVTPVPNLFTGSMSYGFPIATPPAPGDMRPALELTYNNQNGNSWVGFGWSLDMGVIERQTKALNYNLQGSYRMSLDDASADLVRTGGNLTRIPSSQATEGADDYAEKIRKVFYRIQQKASQDSNTYWVVTDKKGTQYRFGKTSASRMDNPQNAVQTFRWYLDHVEDIHGNYMDLTYTKILSANTAQANHLEQIYLTRIDFGGNSKTNQVPQHYVKFYLEPRPDVETSYAPNVDATNFGIRTDKRLKTIEVRANGSLYKLISLNYSNEAATSRSYILQANEFGKDATIDANGIVNNEGVTALPVKKFTMGGGTANTFSSTAVGPYVAFADASGWNWPKYYSTIRYPDLNGDGLADICARDSGGIQCRLRLKSGGWGMNKPGPAFSDWTMNGVNCYAGPTWSCLAWEDWSHFVTIQYPDIDGDGKSDICARDGLGLVCYKGLGDGTFSTIEIRGPGGIWGDRFVECECVFIYEPIDGNIPGTIQFLDLNGDGKADVCARDTNGIDCYLSTGDGFVQAFRGPNWADSGGWGNNYYQSTIRFPDINGDGWADICARDSVGIICHLGLGGSGFGEAVRGPNWGDSGAWTKPEYYSTISFPDVNGDGKADVCARHSGGVECRLSDGKSFKQFFSGPNDFSDKQGWAYPQYYSTFQFPDLNGDGMADVCARSASYLSCYLSNGRGFSNRVTTTPYWADAGAWNNVIYYSTISFPDLNGDGKADVCARNSSGMECHSIDNDGRYALAQIENGIGGRTKINYDQSPNFNNPGLFVPMQVVSSIENCDKFAGGVCSGTNAISTFSYEGGYYYKGTESEFRGFNVVRSTEPAGTDGERLTTVSYFHQGDNIDISNSNRGALIAYTKGTVYKTEAFDQSSRLLTRTEQTYSAPAVGLPYYFTPIAETNSYVFDGQSTARVTRTTSSFDSTYGNPTLSINYGDVDPAAPADETTLEKVYAIPNTTDYVVAALAKETVYAGTTTAGKKLTESHYFYNDIPDCRQNYAILASDPTVQSASNGDLTRLVSWSLKDPTTGKDERYEQRMSYDTVGNVNCKRDALGNISRVEYDPTSTFALVTRNALDQTTTMTYYGVNGVAADNGLYGQLKSVTDPNNATATSQYDTQGRKLSDDGPPDAVGASTTTQGGAIFAYAPPSTFGVVGSQCNTSYVIDTDVLTTILTARAKQTDECFDGLGRTIKKSTEAARRNTGSSPSVWIVSTMEYDARGKVRRQSLPAFSNTTNTRFATSKYDAAGRTLQTVAADGTTTLACYQGNIGVTVRIDANGHRRRETVDAFGRLVKVEEYKGSFSGCDTGIGTPYATTRYEYDLLGRLVKTVDTKGNESRVTYDSLGRKRAMHDPDMGDWTYTYDANGRLLTQTDAKQQTLNMQYDALGRLVQKDYGARKPLGSGDNMYVYDGTTSNGKGRLTSITDASGTSTLYYNLKGQKTQTIQVIDGVTYTTSNTYDPMGRVKTLTYPDGEVVTNNYDDAGNLTSVNGSNGSIVNFSNHLETGAVGLASYANKTQMAYEYNPFNYRISAIKTSLNTYTVSSVPYSWVTTNTALPAIPATNGTLDDGYVQLALPFTFNFFGNNKSTVNVETNGFLTFGPGVSDASSYIPQAIPNSGVPNDIIAPLWRDLDLSTTGNITYNSGANQFAVSYNNAPVFGSTLKQTFQALLNSDGSIVYQYATVANDKLAVIGVENADGTDGVGYSDPANGLAIKFTPNRSTLQNLLYGYDMVGNVTSLGDATKGSDFLGYRTTQVPYSWVNTTTLPTTSTLVGSLDDGYYPITLPFSFNFFGTPNTSAYISTNGLLSFGVGSTSYSPIPIPSNAIPNNFIAPLWRDLDFRSKGSISYNSSASQFVVSYSGVPNFGVAASAQTFQTLLNSDGSFVNQYASVDRYPVSYCCKATSIGAENADGTAGNNFYFLSGGVSSDQSLLFNNFAVKFTPMTGTRRTFVYDELNRLTSATGPFGALSYQYDELGNMTYNSQVGAYTYPTVANSPQPHAATQAGTNSYHYDANGNMDTGAGRIIFYDYENRPSSITVNGVTTTFVYDAFGNRVKKIVNGVATVYIGGIYECTSGNCTKYYFAGAQRVAMKAVGGTQTYYYHADHLGSANLVTDSSGTVVETLEYFPFGGTYTQTGGVDVHHKFTGQELDDSTGLYFYGARYYDAALGRFIQADTIVPNAANPQDLNRYTYVRNNPLVYIDPTGHSPDWNKFAAWAHKEHVDAIAVAAVATAMGCPVCGGALAGYMETGTVEGAVLGGFQAAFMYGAGSVYAENAIAGIIAHGVVGGTFSLARGGNFWQGAAVGMVGKVANISAGAAGGGLIAQGAAAVLGGGVSSVIMGGKFADGARYGAYQFVFNGLPHMLAGTDAHGVLLRYLQGLDSNWGGNTTFERLFGLGRPDLFYTGESPMPTYEIKPEGSDWAGAKQLGGYIESANGNATAGDSSRIFGRSSSLTLPGRFGSTYTYSPGAYGGVVVYTVDQRSIFELPLSWFKQPAGSPTPFISPPAMVVP